MRAITGGIALLLQETAGVPSAFVAFGIEKGLFEKQKLEIDLQPTQGGAATIPALVSGDIQVGGSNVVSLLLASSKDLPIQAIAGGTTAQASGEKDFGALLAAKGKGISGPEDLEGKTVAVNTLNNIAEVVVKAALEKQGGAYAVTDEFAESDPDAVKAFQAAVKETADYVAGHEDEFRTFLSENAKMPPALAKKIVLPKWTGEVDAGSLANTAKLMQKYGVVNGEIDTSKLLQGG